MTDRSFNNFNSNKELSDYSDVVQYLGENDLRIRTAIYAQKMIKSKLPLLRKIEDQLVVLMEPDSLLRFLGNNEEEYTNRIGNMSMNDSNASIGEV